MYDIFKKQIFLFYLITCYSVAYAQNCSHHIEGKITEFEHKEPVAYAQIQLKELQKSVLTDENGNYHFDNICNGTYTLEVNENGKIVKHAITVSAKKSKTVKLDESVNESPAFRR